MTSVADADVDVVGGGSTWAAAIGVADDGDADDVKRESDDDVDCRGADSGASGCGFGCGAVVAVDVSSSSIDGPGLASPESSVIDVMRFGPGAVAASSAAVESAAEPSSTVSVGADGGCSSGNAAVAAGCSCFAPLGPATAISDDDDDDDDSEVVIGRSLFLDAAVVALGTGATSSCVESDIS